MRMQVLFPLIGILFVLSGCETGDDDDMADDDAIRVKAANQTRVLLGAN